MTLDFPSEIALTHVTESGALQLTRTEWPASARALIRLPNTSPNAPEIAELTVVEWSPSGEFVNLALDTDRLCSGWREPVIAAELIEFLNSK